MKFTSHYESEITVDPLLSDTTISLIGVLLGDVNGSYDSMIL